jgi:threonine dehydratase
MPVGEPEPAEVGTPQHAPGVAGLVGLGDIRAAAQRITGRVVRTPLVPFEGSGRSRPLWLKLENLQPIGAFKLRGAYNKMLSIADAARDAGVVTHSSGNHARAVAWVARDLGFDAVIVMPDTAPALKIRAVRDLGTRVEIVPLADRLTRAVEIAATTGAIMVPPYDDPAIIAGAGTIGLEIVEDLPDVDVVLVPVSGGGLISGVAAAVKAMRPGVTVLGVEPELAADAAESLRTGRLVSWEPVDVSRTIADGLRTTSVGTVNWPHIRALVDDIVTVSEAQIRDAVARLALEARVVAEPSGAVTLAAYLAGAGSPAATGQRSLRSVAAVVSGGNIEPALLTAILQMHA